MNRRVYGTSGPRILLHFDLVDDEERHAMGSELSRSGVPRFEVRAVGSFEELPGCPEESATALGAAHLERLCRGECHNPSDVRRPITRLEVVRIRPQAEPGEPMGSLIEDPWRRIDCPGDPAGCVASFEDPDFVDAGRDTVYYVRAYEAPKPTVNGAPLNCRALGEEACAETRPCERGQECLAPDEPRAWSSPIFVAFEAAPG